MSAGSITPVGTPAFRPVSRGQVTVSQGNNNGNGESSSGRNPARNFSLESQVQEKKKFELSREGKELINFKILSDDTRINQQLTGEQSSQQGLKAVMITRGEDDTQDFSVQLLRVRPDGSTTTLFSSDTTEPLQADSSSGDLNFRGSLMDTLI